MAIWSRQNIWLRIGILIFRMAKVRLREGHWNVWGHRAEGELQSLTYLMVTQIESLPEWHAPPLSPNPEMCTMTREMYEGNFKSGQGGRYGSFGSLGDGSWCCCYHRIGCMLSSGTCFLGNKPMHPGVCCWNFSSVPPHVASSFTWALPIREMGQLENLGHALLVYLVYILELNMQHELLLLLLVAQR